MPSDLKRGETIKMSTMVGGVTNECRGTVVSSET